MIQNLVDVVNGEPGFFFLVLILFLFFSVLSLGAFVAEWIPGFLSRRRQRRTADEIESTLRDHGIRVHRL